ncbi:MAG: C-GCAxxG-C-C family protein [Spirochaetales bacterium]|nr:C-GCAxxG-C-C family protein [Spirochaetales bacterium]
MDVVLDAKATKREFWKRFSCSETMFTLLNRAAGYETKELEEASDPLCGRLLAELDAACGVLWRAALAAGVRARNRITNRQYAASAALEATREAVRWYKCAGASLSCRRRRFTRKYFIDREKPKHSMIRSNLQGMLVGDGWMAPSRYILKQFKDEFGTKMCSEISGASFQSAGQLEEHLNAGKCDSVQDTLANATAKATIVGGS